MPKPLGLDDDADKELDNFARWVILIGVVVITIVVVIAMR